MKLLSTSTLFALGVLVVNAQITQAATLTIEDVNLAPGETLIIYGEFEAAPSENFNLKEVTIEPSSQDGIALTLADFLRSVIGANRLQLAAGDFFVATASADAQPGTYNFTATFIDEPAVSSSDFTVTVIPEPVTMKGRGYGSRIWHFI